MPQKRFAGDRPILLVGLPGAGKTTVGRRLAERLGLPFADSDREIERAAGLSVAQLFDRFGEAGFRRRERETVARLAAGPARVIAGGGGAFVDARLRALALARCRVVWLDADIETLARRIGGRDDRPLLRGRDPAAALADLAERRAAIYAEAHLRIDARGPAEAVAEAALAALAERAA